MSDMQWTLLTYPGISVIVVMMIGGVKKLWPTWVVGKEPHIGLALCIVLGVLAKLTVANAFTTVQWVPHIVFLIGSAFGAKLTHDYLVNEVIKGKETKK